MKKLTVILSVYNFHHGISFNSFLTQLLWRNLLKIKTFDLGILTITVIYLFLSVIYLANMKQNNKNYVLYVLFSIFVSFNRFVRNLWTLSSERDFCLFLSVISVWETGMVICTWCQQNSDPTRNQDTSLSHWNKWKISIRDKSLYL